MLLQQRGQISGTARGTYSQITNLTINDSRFELSGSPIGQETASFTFSAITPPLPNGENRIKNKHNRSNK